MAKAKEAKKLSTDSPSPEDAQDIAVAAEAKTLYLKEGKTAFTPLRDYQKRRQGVEPLRTGYPWTSETWR